MIKHFLGIFLQTWSIDCEEVCLGKKMSSKAIKLNRDTFTPTHANYHQSTAKSAKNKLLRTYFSQSPKSGRKQKNCPFAATASSKKTAVLCPIRGDCDVPDKSKFPLKRSLSLNRKKNAGSELIMPIVPKCASVLSDGRVRMISKLDQVIFKADRVTNVPNPSKTVKKSVVSTPVVKKLVRCWSSESLEEVQPKSSSISKVSKKGNPEQRIHHVMEESKSRYNKNSGSTRCSYPSVKKSPSVKSQYASNYTEKGNPEQRIHHVMEESKSRYDKNSGSTKCSYPSFKKLPSVKSQYAYNYTDCLPSGSLSSTSQVSLVNKTRVNSKNASDGYKNSESGNNKKLEVTKSFRKTSPQMCTSSLQSVSLLEPKKVLESSKVKSCSLESKNTKPLSHLHGIKKAKNTLNSSLPNENGISKILSQTVSQLNSSQCVSPSIQSQTIPKKNTNEQSRSYGHRSSWEERLQQTVSNQPYSLKRSVSGSPKFHEIPSNSSRTSNAPRVLPNFLFKTSSVLESSNTSSHVLAKVPCSQDTDRNIGALNDSLETDVEMEDMSTNLQSLDVLNFPMEVDDNLPCNHNSYVFVVDTNIFIHDLNFVDELKDTSLEGCGPPIIYIPWIVFCELDGLKSEKNNENRFKVISAVRYLYSMLYSKHPRIRGQTAKMSRELEEAYGNTNDDRLLSYCSFLAEKYSKERVCLLTNDKNLCNKAIVNDVKVYTRETLFQNIIPDMSLYNRNNGVTSVINRESKVPDDVKPMNEKMQIDTIICEAKLILKNVLEPFLVESLEEAFGHLSKKFLTPPPTLLVEILECYKKYWNTVFGFIFNRNLKDKFEKLIKLFSHTKGFFCNIDEAIAALIAIENICTAVAAQKPNIRPQVQRISELTGKCNMLFKSEDNNGTEVSGKNSNEIAFAVFSHIWCLIHHYCGMILDFGGVQHSLKYDKPSVTPTLAEFQILILNLIPAMHKIKQAMAKVIDISSAAEQEKHAIEYKHLYDYLIQFAPSLQIQAQPPPTDSFTVQGLKDFCIDPEYREKFKNGYRQLTDYQKMLTDCIRLPIWQS